MRIQADGQNLTNVLNVIDFGGLIFWQRHRPISQLCPSLDDSVLSDSEAPLPPSRGSLSKKILISLLPLLLLLMRFPPLDPLGGPSAPKNLSQEADTGIAANSCGQSMAARPD